MHIQINGHLARIKVRKAALLHVEESAVVIQHSWRSREEHIVVSDQRESSESTCADK